MSIVGDEDAVTPTSGNTYKKKGRETRKTNRGIRMQNDVMAMCVVALADKSGRGMCHWQTIG